MTMSKDEIYANEDPGDRPFRFNAAVAEVFPDMLRRSIPGYAASIEAARYVVPNSNCYDLGCSLGAASLAMQAGITAAGCRIVAIDNAPAMVERCREIVQHAAAAAGPTPIEVLQADIRETAIDNASMVVMNYTLQFLDRDSRDSIVQRIFDGRTAS